MSAFEKHPAEQMKDAELASAYEALEARYAFARQAITARIEAGITQAQQQVFLQGAILKVMQ